MTKSAYDRLLHDLAFVLRCADMACRTNNERWTELEPWIQEFDRIVESGSVLRAQAYARGVCAVLVPRFLPHLNVRQCAWLTIQDEKWQAVSQNRQT